ncbi:MAG: carbohydrate kinase family protein [Actinobacteria bacterium]|nr:MAG: carbohydrate kinase family protein [Actinomycetota bacterium]
MASRLDLLVVGDVNPDIVLRGDVEPSFGQAEQLVEEAHLTIGGSGAIMACGAARLGLRVALCAIVGDDLFGRWIREQLAARGIDVQGLIVDPEQRTGLTVVLSKRQDRAILTHPGTIAELRSANLDRRLLSETRHLHVSSYFLQRGLAPDLPPLFDEAHSVGATTSVDPNWDPSKTWDGGLTGILTRTDVFLPNATEAVRIARQEDIDRAALTLARSAHLVVAKLGPQGAIAAQGTRLVRLEDTTGAGDSFDAGFLASWLEGDPLERSLALGAACGALSTRALGGVDGQPTMEEARGALAGLPAGSG